MSNCEVRTQYTYNGRDQLTALRNTLLNGTGIWNFNWNSLIYDAAGNRTQATIIGSEVRNGAADPITGLNNLAIPRTDGTATWTYDNKDRLTGESRTNTAGFSELTVSNTAGYAYDDAYNVTTLRSVVQNFNSNNQLSGAGYTYDGDGNPELYAGGSLGYDEESRLRQLTISGGTSPAYRAGYRGDGLRAWRVSSSGTVTYFVYDDASGTLQYEVEGSAGVYTIRNAYGYGAAGLAQRFQTSGNVVTSFAYDPSGNTITRSQSSGNAASPSGYPRDVAIYDAYGQVSADVASANTSGARYRSPQDRYSFTAGYSIGFGGQFGYYTESNTKLSSLASDRGLILCTHRYYDPINARWLTRDPIGYDGDINLYGYVQGNPVMSVDPSGLKDEVVWWNPATWFQKPKKLTPAEEKIFWQLFTPLPNVDPDIFGKGTGPAVSAGCGYIVQGAQVYMMSGGFRGRGNQEKFSINEEYASYEDYLVATDPQARISSLIGKYNLAKSVGGRKVIYGGAKLGVAGGVRTKEPLTIRIYDEGLRSTDRVFVETLFEELHHSRLMSLFPESGRSSQWMSVVEPRAKAYAKSRADRMGLPQ